MDDQPVRGFVWRAHELRNLLILLAGAVSSFLLPIVLCALPAVAQEGTRLDYRLLWDPEDPGLEEWQALGRGTATFPGMMVWGEHGEFFLIAAGRAHVLRLTRNGELLQIIGRRGGGPGEFTRPVAMDYDEESKTLWVADGNFRYSRFTFEDGNFVYRDSFTSPNTWAGMRPILIVESGDRFWGTGRSLGPSRSLEDAMGTGRIKLIDLREGILREFGAFWEVDEGSDWNAIDPRLRNSGYLYQIKSGNLVWVWLYRPVIEVWDREGKLLTSNVFEDFPVVPPRKTGTYTTIAPTVMGGLIYDGGSDLLFISPPQMKEGRAQFLGLNPDTLQEEERFFFPVPGASAEPQPDERFGGLEMYDWDDLVVAPVIRLAERIDGEIRFYGVDVLSLTPIVLYPTPER